MDEIGKRMAKPLYFFNPVFTMFYKDVQKEVVSLETWSLPWNDEVKGVFCFLLKNLTVLADVNLKSIFLWDFASCLILSSLVLV